jgi:uncharacterized protein (TIRG00374 family)
MEAELAESNRAKLNERRKEIAAVILRILVSATILYFLFSLVQWENVLNAYRSADGLYIFVGALLLAGNLGVRALKWRTMLAAVKRAPTFWESFGSIMLGISLGSFTPGELGEFAGRTVHITNARRSHLVGLVLLDRAQIFIITACFGLLSVFSLTLENAALFSCAAFGLIIVSLILFFRLDLFAKIAHRINASFFQREWITKILDGFCLLQTRQLAVILLYTLGFWGILVLQMYCLINAFSSISFVDAFVATSSMMLVKSLLPISLGDLGIREASTIFFFSSFGVSQAAALNASLLLFFINVFFPGAAGAFFLKHQSLRSIPIPRLQKKRPRQSTQ